MSDLDHLRVRRSLIREARAEADPAARELLVFEVIQLDAKRGRETDRHLLEWLRGAQ